MDAIADKASEADEAAYEQVLSDANLKLWRHNEMTDPGHTKPTTIGGRSFTSIDGYYQVKRATETFGPLGVGWGWELEEEVVEVNGSEGPVSFAKCKVTLWYVPPGAKNGKTRAVCGPVVGMNHLVSKQGRGDDEAFKKATTDAVTKALSYLGFSADVFMGLYDDNKYVSQLKATFTKKAEQQKAALPAICTKSVELLPEVKDLAELSVVWKSLNADLKKLPPAQLDYMKARFAMRKRQLGGGEPDADESNLPPPDHQSGEPYNSP